MDLEPINYILMDHFYLNRHSFLLVVMALVQEKLELTSPIEQAWECDIRRKYIVYTIVTKEEKRKLKVYFFIQFSKIKHFFETNFQKALAKQHLFYFN